MTEKCCGTCRYHRLWYFTREWICEKESADAYTLETEYSDSCEEWEER